MIQTKFRFTKEKLVAIENPAHRTRYRDLKVEGLVLDVLPSGRKSFRVYKRVKGASSPVNVTLGKFPDLTIENARKNALATLEQIAGGVNPNEQERTEAKSKVTLLEVYRNYMACKTLSDRTVIGYEQIINSYLKDWQGMPIAEIGEHLIKERHRLVSGSSKAQADYCMRLLRAIFNFAIFEYRDAKEDAVFIKNPVRILSHQKLWNNVPRKQTRITKTSLKPWFEGIAAMRIEGDSFMRAVCDFVEMALLTGLRKTELLTLKWEQVSFDEKSFYISKTKNGMPLELPMGDYLLTVFERRRAETDNDFVFQADNEYGYIREPKKRIQEINDITGVKFSLHDLRRTFTSTAELLKVGTYTLKRLLNHKTKRDDVTAGYTVLTAEELREPAQLIENHIMQLAGIYKPELSIKEKLFAALKGLSEHQQLAMLEKIAIEAG